MALIVVDFDVDVAFARFFCDDCGSMIFERIVPVEECREACEKKILCHKCRSQ